MQGPSRWGGYQLPRRSQSPPIEPRERARILALHLHGREPVWTETERHDRRVRILIEDCERLDQTLIDLRQQRDVRDRRIYQAFTQEIEELDRIRRLHENGLRGLMGDF